MNLSVVLQKRPEITLIVAIGLDISQQLLAKSRRAESSALKDCFSTSYSRQSYLSEKTME